MKLTRVRRLVDCPIRMNGVLAGVQWMIAITRRFFRILAMRAGQPVAAGCGVGVRLRVLVVAGVALGVLGTTAVSAVTVDQVVALKRAGVTDAVVLALIDRDRTVFGIEPEQIIALQRD